MVGMEMRENERVNAPPALAAEKLHGAFPGVVRDPASAAVDHRGMLPARENDAFPLPDVERCETERIAPLESRNARGGKEQRERNAYRRESTEAPGFPRAQPRGEKKRVYEREPAEKERIAHINVRAREA